MLSEPLTFFSTLTASRVARNASQGQRIRWQKGRSAAVLAFVLVTALRSSRPEYPLPSFVASRATHRGFG
jgi:hypothetical protein